MNTRNIICTVILIVLLSTTCQGGPGFWVKCSACNTTQTNAARAATYHDNTTFFCGTGMSPFTFLVLTQCGKCHQLGTVNLLQTEEDAFINARRTGAPLPDNIESRQKLVENAILYQDHSASTTQRCPLCSGELNIVYFPFKDIPESGDPLAVHVPLSAICPTCESNSLEAISAGMHYD